MKYAHTYCMNKHEKNNEKQMMNKGIKNKKRKKSRYTIAIILFILVLLSSGMVLLGMSSVFNISAIQVVGAKHCKSEDVIKASGIWKGTNGFKNIGGSLWNFICLRYGQVEANILRKFSYVKNVTVRYVLPNKVLIQVEEREPFVLIPYIGAFLLIDKEGYVLETLEGQEEASLPIAKGLDFVGYELGQALKIKNMENFDMLIILLNALTEEEKNDNFKLIDQIDIIDVSDAENICVFINSRLVVNYGDLYDLSYRIKMSKQIVHKSIDKNEKGILDFTKGDYPVFMPWE